MIPKIIHYCWFGGKPLPYSAQKCINSWKKYFPDYEIIQWNENNYDIKKIEYIRQAYSAKKYAFVSDYARFDILYQHGGLYFDADVEVIKPFGEILKNGAYMGCETDGLANDEGQPNNRVCNVSVNTGLGIAAPAGLKLYKEILDYYETQQFLNDDGKLNTETVVTKVTTILLKHGLKDEKGIQRVDEITIYPKEYFNPLNNNTGEIEVTNNTHSIHWYNMTWISPQKRLRSRITRPFHRLFGEDIFSKLGLKR